MSLFWVMFTLTWSSYAAFIGFTAYLCSRHRGPQLVPFLCVSALILAPTLSELIDQNAFQQARVVTYPLSGGAMALLIASWFVARSMPDGLAKIGRSLSAFSFLFAVLWSLGGPGGLFLPLLFFPNREVLGAHLIFSFLFLVVVVATFLGLRRIRVDGSNPPAPLGKSDAKAKRPRSRWRFALNLALALILLFWLAQWAVPRQHGGLVSSAGEAGMSPQMLDDTEVLCSGHFSQNWQVFRWCWRVRLKVGDSRFAKTVLARRKIIPFIVDRYWKGSGPLEIDVAVFEPSEGFWANGWQLPAQENLLVALKKDTTGSSAYQLVTQANSWLVIAPDTKLTIADTAPDKVIEGYTYEYLQRYAAGAEAQRPVWFSYALTIDSIAGMSKTLEINNVSVIRQALATARNFRMANENTLALLKQMLVAPEADTLNQSTGMGTTTVMWTSGSPVRQEVLSTLVKLAPDSNDVMTWIKEYNSRPAPAPATPGQFAVIGGDVYSNLPWELAKAVQDCDRVEKMMPLITQALASPNPRMREEIARALAERQREGNNGYQLGNQLGNQFFPILIKLIDDPDPKVQGAAMAAIFWMSGEFKKHPQERELTIWATFVHEQNPDLLPTQVKQYKAWWEKQQNLISRTQNELTQIRNGLIDYEAAYGEPPASTNPRELMQFLEGQNPKKTAFITFESWEMDARQEPIDAWGTKIRISLGDLKIPSSIGWLGQEMGHRR